MILHEISDARNLHCYLFLSEGYLNFLTVLKDFVIVMSFFENHFVQNSFEIQAIFLFYFFHSML